MLLPALRARCSLRCAPSAVAAALVATMALPTIAAPQAARIGAISLPTSDASDALRLRELAGDTSTMDWTILRSPSLAPQAHLLGSARGVTYFLPAAHLTVNSDAPFSMNDGAMWAGRGASVLLTSGVALHTPRVRVLIAPDFWATTNARFDRNRDWTKFYTPAPPVSRYGNGFADPWYVQPYSADIPWRQGSSPRGHLWWGQSGLWLGGGTVEFGLTSENEWWGPGIRNAIVMSDNAAGVGRLELRTRRPWHGRFGSLDARWFTGALEESQYFDTDKRDDVRSLAAAAVAWRPWFQPTLTLGATRAVYATAPSYGAIPLRWFDVLANTGAPANHPVSDSSLTPGGRDQLVSLFARWVFVPDGLEVYGEWARQEFPTSLKDFVKSPTHSHGYTAGLQYRRPAPLDATTLRVQGEITTLEQSSSFATRPVGVFYTSRRVVQGYTQLGQVIGAAIGPGSSSQWLAVDRVGPDGYVGLTFNRIRWNEDVRSTHVFPGFLGYCNHDVSVLGGARAGRQFGFGYMSGAVSVGTRFNAFFQSQSGCPTGGPSKIDLHPLSLTISYSPFAL